MRSIDVKGREIGVFKTLINKGFSRLEIFFRCLAVPFNLENPYFYLLRKQVDRNKVCGVELTD